MQTKITAILSDYDGTLCPTDSVKSEAGTIPEELEQILVGYISTDTSMYYIKQRLSFSPFKDKIC